MCIHLVFFGGGGGVNDYLSKMHGMNNFKRVLPQVINTLILLVSVTTVHLKSVTLGKLFCKQDSTHKTMTSFLSRLSVTKYKTHLLKAFLILYRLKRCCPRSRPLTCLEKGGTAPCILILGTTLYKVRYNASDNVSTIDRAGGWTCLGEEYPCSCQELKAGRQTSEQSLYWDMPFMKWRRDV